MKKILANGCMKCFYYLNDYCNREGREIKRKGKIPKWCPLPDKIIDNKPYWDIGGFRLPKKKK